MEEDLTLKFLTLGDPSVGKTSIMLRFTEDHFTASTMPTLGVEYKTRRIVLQGKSIKLQLWDTAGQEKHHRSIASAFYRRVVGFVLVFNWNDPKSFEHVQEWMGQIRQHASPSAVVCLVGNKADLVRQVEFAEGQRLAASYGIQFLSVSAKTGENIEKVFETLAAEVVAKDPALFSGPNQVLVAGKTRAPSCCN